MEKELVSIITPCYNGEKFLYRLFDSILSQTYSSLELIFVDDGSTDNTKSKALSYASIFEKRGIKFLYIYQENKGQAAALNNGLQFYTGEYLTWPDSDDLYASNYAIEKMVNVLKNSLDDVSAVRCNATLLDGNTLQPIGEFRDKKKRTDLLYDCIHCIDFWFTPGCYMAKSKILDKLIKRQIYIGKGGQNWQMMIPLFYKNKCEYLDENLFYYLVRKDSHSHEMINSNLDKKHQRIEEHRQILEETIDRLSNMKKEEKRYWKSEISNKYLKELFHLYVSFGEREKAKKIFKQVSQINIFSKKDIIRYFMIHYTITNMIYNATLSIKRRFASN